MSDMEGYLGRVRRYLRVLPRYARKPVLNEVARAITQQPEAPVDRLGPPREVARAAVAGWVEAVDRARTPWQQRGVALAGGLGAFLVAEAVLGVPMLAQGLQGWERHMLGPWVRLALELLPSTVLLALPCAALFFGLGGLVALARWTRPAAFPALARWFCLAGLVLGPALAGATFAFEQLAVAPANRALMDDLLQADPTRQRTAQELTYGQLRERIAAAEAGAAAEAAAGLTDGLDAQRLGRDLHELRMKLAFPALVMPMLALGLALGLLFTRRGWPPVLAGVLGSACWGAHLLLTNPLAHYGSVADLLLWLAMPLALAAALLPWAKARA